MKKDTLRSLGLRLKEIRKSKGLRQEDLDKAIGYKYYQRIEAGKVNVLL